jgi:hypothetical protein
VIGKIIRIAPNEYSIDDPAAVKIIYGHSTQFVKSDWYSVWSHPSVDHINLFAVQDIKQHGVVRRQFSSFYSMSTMVQYEGYVDECVETFARRLRNFAHTGEKIDMGRWLHYYAFDVITNITVSPC